MSDLKGSGLNCSGGWPSEMLAPRARAERPETLEITGAGPRGVCLPGVAGIPLTASQAIGVTDAEYLMLRERAIRDSTAGRWVHALDAYRLAVILDPTDPSNWTGLANAYRELGDATASERARGCAEMMRRQAEEIRQSAFQVVSGVPV